MSYTEELNRLGTRLQSDPSVELVEETIELGGLILARMCRDEIPILNTNAYKQLTQEIENAGDDHERKSYNAKALFRLFAMLLFNEDKLVTSNPLCVKQVSQTDGVTILAPDNEADWMRQRVRLAEICFWLADQVDYSELTTNKTDALPLVKCPSVKTLGRWIKSGKVLALPVDGQNIRLHNKYHAEK